MTAFQPGDIVDITIKGARVVEVCLHGDGNGDDLRFTYEAKDGEQWPSAVWAHAPGVFVERVAPEWWPPQAGDLIRVGHLELFGIAHGSNVILTTDHGEEIQPQNAWEKRHEMTLVHRKERQQQGGGTR